MWWRVICACLQVEKGDRAALTYAGTAGESARPGDRMLPNPRIGYVQGAGFAWSSVLDDPRFALEK